MIHTQVHRPQFGFVYMGPASTAPDIPSDAHATTVLALGSKNFNRLILTGKDDTQARLKALLPSFATQIPSVGILRQQPGKHLWCNPEGDLTRPQNMNDDDWTNLIAESRTIKPRKRLNTFA